MITIIKKNLVGWYMAIGLFILFIVFLIVELLNLHGLYPGMIFQLVIMYFIFRYLRLPIRVILNTDENTIEVKFLLSRKRLIHLEEIESFSSHMIKSVKHNTRYEGVVIHLKKGDSILISEFNLQEYISVYIYLQNANVLYLE